jgi:hypothetical protein
MNFISKFSFLLERKTTFICFNDCKIEPSFYYWEFHEFFKKKMLVLSCCLLLYKRRCLHLCIFKQNRVFHSDKIITYKEMIIFLK